MTIQERMRTTLDLDEDVLQAAKELAVARRQTAGQVVSELLRQALASPRRRRTRNGVPLLPVSARHGAPLTMARVNQLRDDSDPG